MHYAVLPAKDEAVNTTCNLYFMTTHESQISLLSYICYFKSLLNYNWHRKKQVEVPGIHEFKKTEYKFLKIVFEVASFVGNLVLNFKNL